MLKLGIFSVFLVLACGYKLKEVKVKPGLPVFDSAKMALHDGSDVSEFSV